MKKLLPGDLIEFEAVSSGKGAQLKVSKVLSITRPAKLWVGEVRHVDHQWVLVSDETCFATLVLKDIAFAQQGLVVAARTAAGAASLDQPITCIVERVLGERTRAGFEIDYALAKYDFNPQFSAEVVKLAESRSTRDIEPFEFMRPDRIDLRDIPLVTIDGESTRDLDDAVWAKRTEAGWRVVVAIADVSHYVKEGDLLDRAAYQNATSVYLPGRVTPMLPECLSTGVCSLNPGVDRLVAVVDMDVSPEGALSSAQCYRGIMRSAARLTYEKTQQFLSGQSAIEGGPLVEQNLHALHALYKVLHQRRVDKGKLSFNDSDVKLGVSDRGSPCLVFETRTDAHKLVEEVMLLTNEAAAQRLSAKLQAGLYRHQAAPTQDDWMELKQWAACRGYSIGKAPSLQDLVKILEEEPNEETVAIVGMRARKVFTPAFYAVENAMHFSLGMAAYTHFTSPIRRYADLQVHRLLFSKKPITPDKLKSIALHCSNKNRDARMAERYVWDILKKRIFTAEVPAGAPVTAQIVASGKRGLRVVVSSHQCSGFIPAKALADEGYAFNETQFEWSKNTSRLEPGKQLRVSWETFENEQNKIDLLMKLEA